MRRNIDGNCSPSCCRSRDIRTINTMNPDDSGNFTIRGDQGIHVTVGTNEIIISGIAMYYDNTDGNLVIDNDLLTIDLADDIVIAGDLTVNGTYYTVHAEHVYTEDDYIIMRDGALAGLGSGQYSGFQVKKYDGTNDGRLVIDNTGTARVGDVGDEQPLLTRAETGSLTNGQSLVWDSANSKAITQAIPSDISTALAGKQNTLSSSYITGWTSDITMDTNYSSLVRYGNIVIATIVNATIPSGDNLLIGGLPTIKGAIRTSLINGTSWMQGGIYANDGWTGIRINNTGSTISGAFGQFIFVLA